MRTSSAPGRLRIASRVAFAALIGGGAVACSLINSFDDVKPAVAVASDATVDAPVEAGPSEAGDAGPSVGVIVIGGVVEEDGGKQPVLTALSPATGAELPMARVKFLVAAVHYDGLRDLWYVFDSSGATHFPTPTDRVFLHVRRLDAMTGAWQEIQSIKVPTLVANTHVAVLRERLAYIAYRADGQVGNDLVVIDTTDPSQPSLIGAPTPLVGEPIGVIGTPGGTTAGGSITLLYDASQGLDAGICSPGPFDGGGQLCLESQLVKVASEGLPSVGPLGEVGTHIGSPAFGTFLGNGSPINYIGFSAAPPAGILQGYAPVNGQPDGTPIKFQIGDPYLRPIAFADCIGQALLIGTNTETAVTAVPVTTAMGVGDRAVMDHSGQSVHFEPFTSTVLAPFTQGEGFELTAFKLTGTAGAPKLTLRQAPDWSPPAHLRPEIVGTRIPVPFTCPAAP